MGAKNPLILLFPFPLLFYLRDMESVNINTLWEKIQTFLQSLTPLQMAMIGGGIVLLFILIAVSGKSRRRKRLRKFAPHIILESFQISPLGRDAFFKIKNKGEVATLTALFIRGRQDIVLKNAFAGHELHRDKSYSILMEVAGNQKINNDFAIELNYLDKIGNVYKQVFELSNKTAKSPKLVKAR